MRQLSAGMIKGRSAPKLMIPELGTKVRFVYDYLFENRGRVVSRDDVSALTQLVKAHPGSSSSLSTIIYNLRDYWGCDIRCSGNNRPTYIFLGEWCGRVYIDYTRPATEQADLPANLLDRVPISERASQEVR